MHWLQPEPTRAEFRRIAKPGTWLAIAGLRMVDERFLEAMRELRTPENGFRTRNEDPFPGDVPVEYYFAGKQYQTLTFSHTHQQTFEAFLGGLQSGASAPDEDHPCFDNFRQAAQDVFERFSSHGLMRLQVSTEIHYGAVK